jgi:solute carrier family 35 (UDP-sugar transporter), member A1/2/3
VLVVQSSAMVLVLRASRQTDELYITSSAVLVAEVLKLIVCLFLVYRESLSFGHFCQTIRDQVLNLGWDSVKILVPSCLYILQNNLLFVALSKLDAATYQVTYQLKILTTAVFTVILLRRKLGVPQWTALLILFLGVSLVQLNGLSDGEDDAQKEGRWIGLLCIIGACLLSGLAGVYLELVLKYSKPSVWVRNIQLSLFSLIPGLLAVFWTDGSKVVALGFFYGYSPLVWLVIVLQACSGLLVAVVVKYADNILKGFATSISIVLSSLLSMIIFAFHPTFLWIVGSSLVIFSTVLYAYVPPPAPKTSPLLPLKEPIRIQSV